MALIQWFIDFFAATYTNFRRAYFDYIVNTGNTQSFTWVTVTLKVASQQVPYFNDANSAATGLHPDGHLPENLSPYYLKERPVAFTSKDVTVIKCNIYLAGDYRDVFVRIDATQMDVDNFSFSQEQMATMAQQVLPLNSKLQTTVPILQKFYNNKVNLLRNSMTDADRSALIERVNRVGQALVDIRNNPAYLVKISNSCTNIPDNNSLQFFKNQVDVIAAVSWAQYQSIANNANGMQAMIIQLQQYENLTNDAVVMNEAVPSDTVMTPKKDNTLWYILAGFAGLYLLTDNRSSNGKD